MTPFHDELAATYRAARARLSPRQPKPLPAILTTPKAVMESAAYVGTKGRANAILDEVAAKHGICVGDMISPYRGKLVSLARAEACYRLRDEVTVHGLPMSFPMIARTMQKDTQTVQYNVRRWKQRSAGK